MTNARLRLLVLSLIVAAITWGCQKPAPPPAAESEPSNPAAADGAKIALPPAVQTNPLRFAPDEGLYAEPTHLLREAFAAKQYVASDDYVVFLDVDGRWLAIELATPSVLGSGDFQNYAVGLRGIVGTTLVFDESRKRRGLDLETGQFTENPPPVEKAAPRNIAMDRKRTSQSLMCERTEDGLPAWSMPCRRRMVRHDDLILSWDFTDAEVEARSWTDGEVRWNLALESEEFRWVNWASTADHIWMHFRNEFVDAHIAIDPRNGDVVQAVGAETTQSLWESDPRRPDRSWWASKDHVGVVDFTQQGPPRRATVALSEDVSRWMDELIAEVPRSQNRIAGAMQTEQSTVVAEMRERGSAAFVRLAGVLPAEVLESTAQGHLKHATSKELIIFANRLAQRDAAATVLQAAVRQSFAKPPTPEWIAARTALVRQLLGYEGERYKAVRSGVRLPDAFLTELVTETAMWVTEAASTHYLGKAKLEIAPGMGELLLAVTELSAVATSTPHIARPLMAAVASRSRPPFCPWTAVTEYSKPAEPFDCAFTAPPPAARLSPSGDLAVWFHTDGPIHGEVVVMRRHEGEWTAPQLAGFDRGEGEWFPRERLADLRFDESGSTVVVHDGERRMRLDWEEIERDTDADGWTDLLEHRLGTNFRAADTDGDGSPDPLDPMTGCARKEAVTDRQRLFEAVARYTLSPRNDGAPMLAIFDEADCVEVPTLGGPIIRPSEAFLKRLGGRRAKFEQRAFTLSLGAANDNAPKLLNSLHTERPRWYVAEPPWRGATVQKVVTRTWFPVQYVDHDYLFVDLNGDWRRIGESSFVHETRMGVPDAIRPLSHAP